MTAKNKDDLFYVCSLIEHIGRTTKNKRGYVVEALGEKGIRKMLRDAEVNHCLSFEQVGEEVAEWYGIADGNFDPAAGSRYSIPSAQDIGRLYSIIIQDCAEPENEAAELINVFKSPISDLISNFKSDLYYQNPSYLEASYKAGYLLD
jgi:hypothetical protein